MVAIARSLLPRWFGQELGDDEGRAWSGPDVTAPDRESTGPLDHARLTGGHRSTSHRVVAYGADAHARSGPQRGVPRAAIVGEHLSGASEDPVSRESVVADDIEMIVSFGHRHIVPAGVLDAVDGRALNLHISMLPWNRGSDPNLWSWLENAPKGVTVHWMTGALDQGDIAGQRQTALDAGSTLRETYAVLRDEIVELFAEVWPAVVQGGAPRIAQPDGGSYHRSSDKERHLAAMPDGWDARCELVAEYGRNAGLWLT